ncbi:hypothetical protein TSAR_012168 [Trichomalopsis sarcophagae]|uniref:Uncharacterized protein n=1 Tax=Trichomalopsis sarcophagae TaxID=543379 RepID=A0A232FKI4_9HYME|nr:hypothetical protein TSAR_012168 [Trichomalopsis sarcophagae]
MAPASLCNFSCWIIKDRTPSRIIIIGFSIENEFTRFYRRFGYKGRKIRGIFPEQPMNADFHSWLQGCVRDLHRQLCERDGLSDYIGLTINSEQFNRRPLWLSFRLIGDFLIEDL